MKKPRIFILDGKDELFYKEIKPIAEIDVDLFPRSNLENVDGIFLHYGFLDDYTYSMIEKAVGKDIPIFVKYGGNKKILEETYPLGKFYHCKFNSELVKKIKEIFG